MALLQGGTSPSDICSNLNASAPQVTSADVLWSTKPDGSTSKRLSILGVTKKKKGKKLKPQQTRSL